MEMIMSDKQLEILKSAKDALDKLGSLKSHYDTEIAAIQDGQEGTSVSRIASAIRAEMQATFELYRKEMEKNAVEQRRRHRREALLQWLAIIAGLLGSIVKEALF